MSARAGRAPAHRDDADDVPSSTPCLPGRVAAELVGATGGYGRQAVLREVDLRLHAGAIHVVVGPNGAGKSSLLRAFCGLMPLRAGRAFLDGARLGTGSSRNRVSLVPQERALYPRLTVRENIDVFAGIRGVPRRRIESETEAVLSMARLDAVADRQVNVLSGGFQRRVNIAVGLLGSPDVLLLDEPTVALDVEAAAAVGDLLRAVREGGAAVLVATHDFVLGDALADVAAVMVGGRLVDQGTPADLAVRCVGHTRMAEVRLAGRPDEATTGRLRRLGYRTRPGEPLVWTADMSAGRDVSTVASDLSGIAVESVTVRSVGLADIYGSVLAREAGR